MMRHIATAACWLCPAGAVEGIQGVGGGGYFEIIQQEMFLAQLAKSRDPAA